MYKHIEGPADAKLGLPITPLAALGWHFHWYLVGRMASVEACTSELAVASEVSCSVWLFLIVFERMNDESGPDLM